MDKIGKSPPAEILEPFPLYSKMANGLLWHIGALGCVSRATGNILKFTDAAYWRAGEYGDTSDRDREPAADFMPHESPR